MSRVSEWPGQEAHKGECKIPTLVWYDRNKKVRETLLFHAYIFFPTLVFLFYDQAAAFGAEALSAEIEDEAEEKGWTLAKHFKLHLHPQTMKEKYNLAIDRTC